MQRILSGWAVGAFCLMLLAPWLGHGALAQDAARQHNSLGDLSPFRAIAEKTLTIVNAGDLVRAKTRIKDLETAWDKAEETLRPRDPERWRTIDKAIDVALAQLRASRPQASAAKDALQNLLGSLDQPTPSVTAVPGNAAIVSARLAVTNIIDAVEKLRTGEAVLDISFEPKDGHPLYAVRTYANGKVWDGFLDGSTGAEADPGTVMEEAALDAEDKAEIAALTHAKIALRQAIASAEKASGGRALNAGLEQVRGRAVWEILVQNGTQSQQVHVDPITGQVL
jgi:uncharacterized membrane protein YkoI